MCYEAFDTGSFVPRLLPCTHTVCERCIGELLKGRKTLNCPQCRKRHSANSGLKAFPENKYILKTLERPKVAMVTRVFTLCVEHERERSLYCKDARCGAEICQLCHIQDHKFHDVVDIFQEEQTKLQDVQEYGLLCKDTLLAARKDIQEKSEECIEKERKKKSDCVRIFNSRIKQITGLMKEQEKRIDEQRDAVDLQLVQLDSLKEQSKTHLSPQATSRLQVIQFVKQGIRDAFEEKSCYTFLTCEDQEITEDKVKNVCGELRQKQLPLNQHCPLIKFDTIGMYVPFHER